MADINFYVQIEPEWNWNKTQLLKARATKLTQKSPEVSRGPIIKITLRIPDSAFKPVAHLTVDVPPMALDYEPTIEFKESQDGAA